MTNKEFYNLLDQAGHRLGSLAKNNPAYEFELHKLIEIVESKYASSKWKGLTTDELCDCVISSMSEFTDTIYAIKHSVQIAETKLKEKNANR